MPGEAPTHIIPGQEDKLTMNQLRDELEDEDMYKLDELADLYLQHLKDIVPPGETAETKAARERMQELQQEITDQLKEEAGDSWHYWDTIAWVMIRCHDEDSPEYRTGTRIVQDLLSRNDIPDYAAEILKKKYGPVLSKTITSEDIVALDY